MKRSWKGFLLILARFFSNFNDWAKPVGLFTAFKGGWLFFGVWLIMMFIGTVFDFVVLNIVAKMNVAKTTKIDKIDMFKEWDESGYSGPKRRLRTNKNLVKRQKFDYYKKLREYVENAGK